MDIQASSSRHSICIERQVFQWVQLCRFANSLQPSVCLFSPPVRSVRQITLESENTNILTSVLHAYMDISLTATIFLDLLEIEREDLRCLQAPQQKFYFIWACHAMVFWQGLLAIYHFECFIVSFIFVVRRSLAYFTEIRPLFKSKWWWVFISENVGCLFIARFKLLKDKIYATLKHSDFLLNIYLLKTRKITSSGIKFYSKECSFFSFLSFNETDKSSFSDYI